MSDATDSPVICGVTDSDPRAWVPMADYERVRRKKVLMTECLMSIAQAMNKLADGLDAENTSLDDETRPAPLGD